MALVMLPCDLPWWASVQKQLDKFIAIKNPTEMIEVMKRIHDMCNISLDPDDETDDPQQFVGLLNFLDNELTIKERSVFLNTILPSMAARASALRQYRPTNGLHFSLQQQPDSAQLDYKLVASLIANAFFSTFPKRTDKTHPTLQNFNFSNFFQYLDNSGQKAKLRSVLHYFEWLDHVPTNCEGHLTVQRHVMSSREWLTIEDWLECTLPLCPLQIRHEGRLDRASADCLTICFASNKVGGHVLEAGNTQETLTFATIPELLCTLLHVEALEDNEVLRVSNARRLTHISDRKTKMARMEPVAEAAQITICCVDPEDYSSLPLSQFEEDNILRELNKCLLAYQQKAHNDEKDVTDIEAQFARIGRRLSPIGESASLGSNNEISATIAIPLIKEESCSTNRSGSPQPSNDDPKHRLGVHSEYVYRPPPRYTTNASILNNRRGRFIVLGSSGECLPVNRPPLDLDRRKNEQSSESDDNEEFHSAQTSLNEESDEDYNQRYSNDLESPTRRQTFAERLRDALRRESNATQSSSESGYVMGINVTGSGLTDNDIRIRRQGSTGFNLEEPSFEESVVQESLDKERQWIDKFKSKQSKLSHRSSEYSFSTELSSEMEEVYDQFARWLDDPILEEASGGAKRTLTAHDLAVVQFAGSILKRTLSETFAGVCLPDDCDANSPDRKRLKIPLNAKSMSLELARHKHRLAAQLSQSHVGDAVVSAPRRRSKLQWAATCFTAVVQTLEDICVHVILPQSETNRKLSQIAHKPKDGVKSVASGNWGCGTSKHGDVQLKVVIQWLAASVAGVPSFIYYTCGHSELASLDTLYRILRDRKWSVRELTEVALRHAAQMIDGTHNDNVTLFEELIGFDKRTQ